MWVTGPPAGDRPRIGVMPADHESASAAEWDRVAHESARAAKLLDEASPAQWRLLGRLLGLAPGEELRLPDAGPLERFLAATDGLAEAGLGDDALLARWREAEEGT